MKDDQNEEMQKNAEIQNIKYLSLKQHKKETSRD